MSKDFVRLVIISLLIASPVAYYFMHHWFALTGAGALILTLLTVSYQSIKAALMNPVESLRSE